METILVGSVIVMVLVGVLANIWRFIVNMITPLIMIAVVILVLGYLFGGSEVIMNPTEDGWASVFDILIGEGSGNRIAGAIGDLFKGWYEITVEYWF